MYDSDQSLNNVEKFEATMEPVCHMLPCLLLESRFNSQQYNDLEAFAPFVYKRPFPAKFHKLKIGNLKYNSSINLLYIIWREKNLLNYNILLLWRL